MTTLPESPPSRRPAGRWLAAGIAGGLAVAAAIAVPLAVTAGGSRPAGQEAAHPPATPSLGAAPLRLATSGAALTTASDVAADARKLLAGSLPASSLTADAASGLQAAASAATGGATGRLGAALALGDPRLPGCVGALADGARLLGIDRVSFQHQPALLVVTADTTSRESDPTAYVIGPDCAVPGPTGLRLVVPLEATS